MRRVVGRQYLSDKGKYDIDLAYLEKIWADQNGRCAYTGLPMILPQGAQKRAESSPFSASLDRIDSSKGYVKGNVEFVCLSINYAKNGFSKEEMRNFIDATRKSVKL